jgi:hypothetical protein
MPKPIVNNKIVFQNSYGRILQFNDWLNQGLRTGDSPTLASLQLTGDATVEGNLYVQGNTSILDSNVIEFEDNILLLNRNETGDGVTLNQAGFEIKRGTLENYRIVYNEPDDTFRIGVISNQQAVATREDTPLSNGVMIWNNTAKRTDSRNFISIDLQLTSTTNSTSSTSGALKIAGGVGIEKDMFIDGKIRIKQSVIYTDTAGSLQVSAPQDIMLSPTSKVQVPFNIPLAFGNNNQRIVSNSSNNDIDIYGNGSIHFIVNFGSSLSVPNQVPITFSTPNEKVFADDSNNMVVASSQDITFVPGSGKKVLIPLNVPLAFSNANQYISANLLDDLDIVSGHNIFISPGSGLDVIVPYDNGIKFGSAGLQRIHSDSNNKLYIQASSDLSLNSNTRVNIPTSIPLYLGAAYVKEVSSGSLEVSTQSMHVLGTKNASSAVDGAFVVDGGVGISKDLHVGGDLTVHGTMTTFNTETVVVEDNLLVLNSSPIGVADGGILVKTSKTAGNIYAGAFYKETLGEFTFAYTNTSSNTFVDITDYIPLRASSLHLASTADGLDFSTGSLTLLGGAYIHKNLVVGENITANSIALSTQLVTPHIDCSSITTGNLVVTSTDNTSVISYGGLVIGKDASIDGVVTVNNTSPSTSSTRGAIVSSGGVSVISTENSSSTTSGGALTLAGGAAVSKDLKVGGEIYSGDAASFDSVTLRSTVGSVSYGPIAILTSENASGVTSGGALQIKGGASVALDLYVGGKVQGESASFGSLMIHGPFDYFGNGKQTVLSNTTSSIEWYYFGKIKENEANDLEYCDIQFTCNGSYKFNFLFNTTTTTTPSFFHNYSGDLEAQKTTLQVYNDGIHMHLFALLPPNTDASVAVQTKSGTRFDVYSEGYSTQPNGQFSSYEENWTLQYNTADVSNTNVEYGSITVQDRLLVSDNLPIIGYNTNNTNNTNDSPNASRNVGFLLQRKQTNNDSGEGDVVGSESPSFIDTLPNQSTASPYQVVLSAAASSIDDFYNGTWIKVLSGLSINQVRQVVQYNGLQRVAQLSEPWTNQNPAEGDTISIHGNQNIATFFEEASHTYKIAFTNTEDTASVTKQVGLGVSHITLSSTSPSSILMDGGLLINNTRDSVSLTEGGTLTSYGGAAFGKTLRVGEKILVGSSGSLSNADLQVNQPNSTISLQYDSYSFVDFAHALSDSRFGVIASDSMLSFTYSVTAQDPLASSKALSITGSGLIGINTTQVFSALTVAKNNYITVDGTDGYLGFSGTSSSSGSKIVIYGEDHGSFQNSVHIHGDTFGFFNTGSNNLLLNIAQDGKLETFATMPSLSATQGSVVMHGGLSLSETSNATSATSGGCVTLAGGMAIGKDAYIGSDLYVQGDVIVPTLTQTPSLTFSNTLGCSIISYGSNEIMKLNDSILLSFSVSATPSAESINCQFEFDLPHRAGNFASRTDVIVQCSGYTDDSEVYPIFNVVGVAVPSSTRALVKFHSASTAVHNLMIMCRYKE